MEWLLYRYFLILSFSVTCSIKWGDLCTPNFRDDLRRALFQSIDILQLSEHLMILFGWDNSLTNVLNVTIQEGIVSEEELLVRIHNRLLVIGRSIFVFSQRIGDPEHTQSPQALAYAICNKMSLRKKKNSALNMVGVRQKKALLKYTASKTYLKTF